MATFANFVNQVFKSWTTLRLAEQNCTGGYGTKLKIENLASLVLQQVNKKTDEDDVAILLEDYLCESLNVVCEDESQYGVAKLIVDGYALSAAGKLAELSELALKIPSGCALSQCTTQTIECEVHEDDLSDDDMDDDDGDDNQCSDEPMDDE